MGFYFLSCVLLVRASLPLEYRRGIAEMGLGELEFTFYYHFFDMLFLTAASATLAVLVLHHTARRARRARSAGASFRDLVGLRRYHHAVKASAHRQRTDGTERTLLVSGRRAPNIATPPRPSHRAGVDLAMRGTPPPRAARITELPTANGNSMKRMPMVSSTAAPEAAGVAAESEGGSSSQASPPSSVPASEAASPPPPSSPFLSLPASPLAKGVAFEQHSLWDDDDHDSPTASQGAKGGKAAQDAVAALAAEAAAAASCGPQALIDFAAARLSELDEAGWEVEDAHEA